MDADSFDANGLAWAVSRWDDEVKHRPLVNVHRRTLDDTWRQVLRYFGGDPDKVVGPNHDTLHDNNYGKLLSAAPVPEAGQGVNDEQIDAAAEQWCDKIAPEMRGNGLPIVRVVFSQDRLRLFVRALLSPAPAKAQAPVEVSGETLAQREEVCAAWSDLPDALRCHPGLKRLYRALGGPEMERAPPPQSAQLIEPASSHICDTCKRPAHLGRCADVGDTAWAPLMEGKDAVRYRKLREHAADILSMLVDEWDFFGDAGDQMDAAIDAALSQGQQTEQGSRNGD